MHHPLNYQIDNAYKIGCGRLRQECGLLGRISEEILPLGTHPLLVCTDISAALAADKIRQSCEQAGMALRVMTYNGYCSPDVAERMVDDGQFACIDVIIGCGGGVILDFSKLLAEFTKLPLITVPTSSATCAAYTPISVCYDENGKSLGSPKYEWSIAAVLLDMDILSAQPARLLASGACDALAKKIETEQRLLGQNLDTLEPGFVTCYAEAKFIYDEIDRQLEQACHDLASKKPTNAITNVVYHSIVGAGLVSGLANGRRQCAIAHKVYLFVRTFFTKESAEYLHGELVAIGLVAQFHYNGLPDGAERFAARLHQLGLPASLRELKISLTPEHLPLCYDYILKSSAMAEAKPEDHPRLMQALKSIF